MSGMQIAESSCSTSVEDFGVRLDVDEASLPPPGPPPDDIPHSASNLLRILRQSESNVLDTPRSPSAPPFESVRESKRWSAYDAEREKSEKAL